MEKNKLEMFSQPIPTIRITDESNLLSHEQLIEPRTTTTSSAPPDSLMYPLFDAIQRKSWTKARKLCHQLVLLDPNKLSNIELYIRLEQITNLIDERLHPHPPTPIEISRITSAAGSETSK